MFTRYSQRAGYVILMLLIGFFSLITVFAGCGTKKGEKEKEVVKYAWVGYAKYDPIRISHAEGFDKKFPGVKVTHEIITGNYQTKIFSMIVGNAGLDVFATYTPDIIGNMAKRGAILDLTDFVKNDTELNLEGINKALVEETMYNGRLYGLPANVNNYLLFYNKKHFDEAGLKYPDKNWTWKELIEAGQKLTLREKNGRIQRFGLGCYINWWTYAVLNGAEFWNKSRDRCVINSAISRDTLNFYHDIMYKYRIAPTQADEVNIGQAMNLFAAGKVSIFLGGYWINAVCKQANFSDYGVSYMPLRPGSKRRGWYNGMKWVVAANTKHPKIAYELAKYIVRESELEKLIAMKDSLPIRDDSLLWDKKELWEKRDYLPNGKLLYREMLKDDTISGAVFFNDKGKVTFSELTDSIIIPESDLFLYDLSGKKTAEKTLKIIKDKINKELTKP